MANRKIKFPKEQISLLDEIGSIVDTAIGNTYKYLPFWFKKTEQDDIYELVSLGKLPNDLAETLKDIRGFESDSDKLVRLTNQHKQIMDEKNIIASVYTNASGFLWSICKVDSGTDLGWSDHKGNCKESGDFKTYEDALEDVITLINKCDLDQFVKETPKNKFHWGNYSDHLNTNYR